MTARLQKITATARYPESHLPESCFPESHFAESRLPESNFPELRFSESCFSESCFPESNEFLVQFLDWVRFPELSYPRGATLSNCIF
jgi:hypothetical protein